jgi:hypothetical protein
MNTEASAYNPRPALALFFTAPLVAEYLPGDLPITLVSASLPWLALGGGAILIRETDRRAQRGWPAILVLGMAYAIFEEAFYRILSNPKLPSSASVESGAHSSARHQRLADIVDAECLSNGLPPSDLEPQPRRLPKLRKPEIAQRFKD